MDNLYAIIKAVKPRRVLLTSYTFSADWFESTLYPLFRQDDCESIVVMVDARQAHSSIDNTKSQFGGSRYRVVSATGTAGGIFHPKLAYLETTVGDVLVVSSGNLTAAGQGAQLEVLDAVSATTEPEVFEEFSQFLEKVAVVANLSEGPEWQAVDYFSKRAVEQSKAFPRQASTKRTAYLISSLSTPAGEKLVRLVKQFVPTPTELTVLSPYYDKNVNAISKLQGEIRAKTLQYALGRTAKGEFLAPFAKAEPRHFVTPRLKTEDGPTRPLHAKWFDVCNKSGAAVSMTGSVNATYQSLWRTANVELALARVSIGERTTLWKAAKGKVNYEACEFPAPLASTETVLCKANLSSRSELEIEFTPEPPAGALRIRLFQGQVTNFDEEQQLCAGRTLKLKLPRAVTKSLTDCALWVEVTRTEAMGNPFICQSWVNIERELMYRPSDVDAEKAAHRMEQGQGAYDPEDEYLVLGTVYLALTGRMLNKAGSKLRKTGAASSPDDEIEMTTEELEQDHNSRSISDGTEGNSRLARMLLALSKQVGEKDNGPGEPDDEDEPVSTEDEESESADDKDAPAETQADKRIQKKKADAQERVRRANESLEKAIRNALAAPLPDSKAYWLLPYLIGRELRRHFPKNNSDNNSPKDDSGTILVQALQRYAGVDLTPTFKQSLLPVFACAGAAACLAFSRQGNSATYPSVLSTLEEFAGRTITAAELQSYHAQDFTGRGYLTLSGYGWDDLFPELAKIALAPRLGDRIDDLLRYSLGASEIAPASLTAAEKSFIEALKGTPQGTYKKYSIVPELAPNIFKPGCPQCHLALSPTERARLKDKHIAVCEGLCRRPIVARTTLTASHQFYGQDQAFIAPQKQGVNR